MGDVSRSTPMSAARQFPPWSPRDVTRSTLVALTTAAGVIVCYLTASSTLELSTQLTCVAVAIILVAVAGAGWAALLTDGLRSVRVRRLEVARDIVLLLETQDQRPKVPVGASEVPSLVSGDRMSKYHRPECLLVKGKQVSAATLSEHAAADRTACDVCKPDGAWAAS